MQFNFSAITNNPLYLVSSSYYIKSKNQLHGSALRGAWTSEQARANVAASNGAFDEGLASVCADLGLSLTDTRPEYAPHAPSLGSWADLTPAEHRLPYKKTVLTKWIYKIEGALEDRKILYTQGSLMHFTKFLGISFSNLGDNGDEERGAAVFEIELKSLQKPIFFVHKSYELPRHDPLNPHDYKINHQLNTALTQDFCYQIYCEDSESEQSAIATYNTVRSLLQANQYIDAVWLDGNALTAHTRSDTGSYTVFLPSLFTFGFAAVELLDAPQ